MKKILKFMLIVFVYSVLFIATTALPFSQEFQSANAEADPLSAVFLFISSVFNCYAICFIASNSNWRGMKRAIGIAFSVFMIAAFMTQIETLFFGEAFPILTKADVILIMLSTLPSIVAATLLGIKFFGNSEPECKVEPVEILPLIKRIAVLGLIYTAVYFLFGYFVAWQFEELRVFYSGSAEDAGFIGQLMNNVRDNPIIYPFQFIRGTMFVSFSLPLLFMLRDDKKKYVVSCCLVYLTTAVSLIIPNFLFPDTVRWAHFYEMTSSMSLFGVITGLILCPLMNDGNASRNRETTRTHDAN